MTQELLRGESVAASLEARAAELGAPIGDVDGMTIAPMPCALEGAPTHDPGHLYELKLDGVRAIATKRGDEVHLSGRKMRETKDGYEQEDWIYGEPPGKLTFVTFRGAKVHKVKDVFAGLGGSTVPATLPPQ